MVQFLTKIINKNKLICVCHHRVSWVCREILCKIMLLKGAISYENFIAHLPVLCRLDGCTNNESIILSIDTFYNNVCWFRLKQKHFSSVADWLFLCKFQTRRLAWQFFAIFFICCKITCFFVYAMQVCITWHLVAKKFKCLCCFFF